MSETEIRTWSLSPESFMATQEKVAKLNARATKRGFAGLLSLEYERVVIERDTAIGKVEEIRYETRIIGEPPAYNGWRLIASLEFLSSGVIVKTVPGVNKVDRSLIEQGKCDHCGHKRDRVKAYLVLSEDGKQLQVGSTCLKDFIGWDTFPKFMFTDDVSDEIDGFLSGGFWPASYTVRSVLAAAWATIKLDGYVRAGSYDNVPTKVTTMDILNPPLKREREIRAKYGALAEESYDIAQKTIDFILSDEFAGDNEYVLNMKVAIAADFVTSKQFGLIVSAPQTWARYQERSLIRQREKSEVVNEWVGEDPKARKESGEKAERITVNVRVKSVRYIEGFYGSTVLYTLLADTGHVFKWFASNEVLGDEPTTEFFALTGSIKEWDEFNGMRSTVLTRCKR